MYLADTQKPGAYSVAEPLPKKSFSESVCFVFNIFIDVLKSIGAAFVLLLLSIKKCVSCSNKSISGQVALVTGGGNGLGRQIAFALAEQQCHVAICDLDIIAGNQTAEEIRNKFHVQCEAYETDISDYNALLELRKKIKNDLGVPTILVNNAALISFGSFFELDPVVMERVVRVNVNANFLTTRVFIDGMIEEKCGHIVAIGSLLGLVSCPYVTLYSATKHAMIGFMSSLAEEMIAEGHSDYIKTTWVCPNFINTRRDFIQHCNLRFQPLTPEKVAKRTVTAILNEEKSVIVLGGPSVLIKVLLMLPFSLQYIIKTNVFKLDNICSDEMKKPKVTTIKQ